MNRYTAPWFTAGQLLAGDDLSAVASVWFFGVETGITCTHEVTDEDDTVDSTAAVLIACAHDVADEDDTVASTCEVEQPEVEQEVIYHTHRRVPREWLIDSPTWPVIVKANVRDDDDTATGKAKTGPRRMFVRAVARDADDLATGLAVVLVQAIGSVGDGDDMATGTMRKVWAYPQLVRTGRTVHHPLRRRTGRTTT